MNDFKCILVTVTEGVAHATFNRPHKANAIDETLWFEIEDLAKWADETPEVRVLILSGAGKHFCSGIDFSLIQGLFMKTASYGEGRKQEYLLRYIRSLQDAFTALETCRKPVIAAIHGACLGAGIDLTSACDMRYATLDAKFCVKEVDLGIVADIGTLQRLPPIIGEGLTRELAYTARTFGAEEAHRMGFLNRLFDDHEALLSEVHSIASQIASKPPLAIRGTKQVLNYSRDRSVSEGLNYVATWNAGMLISIDAQEAIEAMMERREPKFPD